MQGQKCYNIISKILQPPPLLYCVIHEKMLRNYACSVRRATPAIGSEKTKIPHFSPLLHHVFASAAGENLAVDGSSIGAFRASAAGHL